jgi:hypothetical protein
MEPEFAYVAYPRARSGRIIASSSGGRLRAVLEGVRSPSQPPPLGGCPATDSTMRERSGMLVAHEDKASIRRRLGRPQDHCAAAGARELGPPPREVEETAHRGSSSAYVLAVSAPKRPRDANQLAKFVVDLATGEAQEPDENVGKDPAAVALGRKGGLKGGKARAAKLSDAERTDQARHAANARWARRDQQ